MFWLAPQFAFSPVFEVLFVGLTALFPCLQTFSLRSAPSAVVSCFGPCRPPYHRPDRTAVCTGHVTRCLPTTAAVEEEVIAKRKQAETFLHFSSSTTKETTLTEQQRLLICYLSRFILLIHIEGGQTTEIIISSSSSCCWNDGRLHKVEN